MEEEVKVIVERTVTETVNVDAELQARVKKFIGMALDEAELQLQFGMSDTKNKLISLVLGQALRSAGASFTATRDESMIALERVFADMRTIPPKVTDAAPVAALAPRIDDQNQRPDDGEVPSL